MEKVDEKRRINMAQEKALESMDYILDYHAAPDFVEVVGRSGGDTVTVRVCNDGSNMKDSIMVNGWFGVIYFEQS